LTTVNRVLRGDSHVETGATRCRLPCIKTVKSMETTKTAADTTSEATARVPRGTLAPRAQALAVSAQTLALAVSALALATVALASLSGCSLLLDFGENTDAGPTIDAQTFDAGPSGDGGDPCNAFEPNETLQTAFAIDPGSYAPLGICPSGDHDFFSFTVDGINDVVIEALFTNDTSMDLEMRLYDDQGGVIDRSETFDSNERIERSTAGNDTLAAGTYFIEVFGFGNTDTNNYTLVLSVTAP